MFVRPMKASSVYTNVDHLCVSTKAARCYTAGVIDGMRSVLESDSRVAYALLFGSRARGGAHGRSDVDIALGLVPGARLSVHEIGDLISRLEAVTGQEVDLVLLDEASPGLAYRAFRDGRVILQRDRGAFVARKARAILEYLDFKPVEEQLAHAVLQAGHRLPRRLTTRV
jgi:predicted nucleotidyltransferase